MKKSKLLSALAATTLATGVVQAEPKSDRIESKLAKDWALTPTSSIHGFIVRLPDLIRNPGGFPKGIPMDPEIYIPSKPAQ